MTEESSDQLLLFPDFDFGGEIVAGIDEAGRGPLCGSVVAAAVVLDPERPIEGLRDSKKLTEAQREELAPVIREQALRKLSDEVPHGIAVIIDEMHQRDNGLWDIKATIICEREAHKGIIIGKGGSMLKRIGTGARIQIEKMTGDRVNLQLFVKVRKDWRDSGTFLKNYGFKDES